MPLHRFRPHHRTLLLVVVASVAAAVLGFALARGFLSLEWGGELSVEAVKQRVQGMGAWGVVFSIVLMIVHSFLPFPAEVVAVVNGLCYGPYWGVAITWVGAMLGAFSAFGLTRLFGRPFVARLVNEEGWRRIDDWSARNGGQVIFVARLIPLIAFNLINYTAGLTKVSWWTFSWTTGLGILPLTIVMVVLGDNMLLMRTETWLVIAVAVVVLWLAFRLARQRLSGR